MASFRDDVRKIAIDSGSSKSILELCDRFRDQDLVNLGVQLDDGQGAGRSRDSGTISLTSRRRSFI
jgi:cysteinyl-tRNA synthetase